MSLNPQDHVIDDFAGAGGWHHALRALDADPHSYELNPDACNTLRATGTTRVHEGDLTTRTTSHQPPARLYVASPPCQGFSMAGLGAGRQPHVMGAITHAATMIRDGRGYAAAAAHVHTVCPDPRVALVLWPLHWALTTRPENIALEQVPAVLPIWQLYARLLADAGYSTAAGHLTAEQYDVPQTRKRAVLIASRTHPVALPTPTRRKYRKGVPQDGGDPALLPWISMAQALGWGMTERPSMTVTGGGTDTGGAEPFGNAARQGIRREQRAGRWAMAAGGATSHITAGAPPRQLAQPAATITGKGTAAWVVSTGVNSYLVGPGDRRQQLQAEGRWREISEPYERPIETPAPTVDPKAPGAWAVHEAGQRTEALAGRVHVARITVQEAAVLQGFPADHPFQGRTKGSLYLQVGNAIPPPLAWHVARAALGFPSAPWGDA